MARSIPIRLFKSYNPIEDMKLKLFSFNETNVQKYNNIGMVCGGQSEGGISPCSGDSGGPLACPDEDGYYLAGIQS